MRLSGILRPLAAVLFILFAAPAISQCPLVYDHPSHTQTATPLFVNCNGNIYTLSFESPSSFGSYTINWGDGSPNTTGASYAANTIITHTYAATTATYAITMSTGTCVVTGTVVQEQAALASIVVPSGVNSTLCAPKTLTFTNGTTFTSATTSYTWNFGETPNVPVVHSYTNAGQNVTHNYLKGTVNCETNVTLMAKNHCNFSPSIASFGPLQVYDKDDALVTADRFLRCWPDAQFNFSNTSVRNCFAQGNNGVRYIKWNFGNYWGMGADSIRNWATWPHSPVSVSYTNTGSYTTMLLDSNMCGIDTAYVSVLIVNSPTAGVIAPAGNICVDASVTFTNSSAPGFSYRWNFGAGAGFQNLGSGNKTTTYTTSGTYTVKLVALIAGGGNACTDTSSVAITVHPRPVSAFSLTPAVGCGSLNVQFTDQSTGAAEWLWTFANGLTSTLQVPPTQNYTVTGSYIPTLQITSSVGCIHSSTASLIVHDVPVPAFATFTGCAGSPVTFTNSSTVSGTNAINGYTWQFGDGGSSTVTAPVHNYASPGTFTIKLKAATVFCSDSLSQAVVIHTRPTASFAVAPAVACPPFTAAFSNLSQNAVGFLWDFGTSPTSTSSSTGANFTYSNSTQSFVTHTVVLVVTSTAGCTDTTALTVTVRPKPVASFTSNQSSGCSPMVQNFTNTTVGGSAFTWTFGDGGTSSSADPAHTYSNSSLFTQTHTVTLIATNTVGCLDTAAAQITVYAEALTSFSMVPSSGCTPLVVNFPSVPGIATYTWNHGDGSPLFTTTGIHSWTYTNPGQATIDFTVQLTAKTSNECFGTGTSSLTVYHRPLTSFTMNPASGCHPLNVTFTNTGQTGNAYTWRFGDGSSAASQNASNTFTRAAGSASVTYTVMLTSATPEGCKDSTSRTVSVFAQPLAAFLPDTPACTPKTMKLKNNSSGASSFRWTFGDGSAVSTQDTAVHLYQNPDAVKKVLLAKLVARNANGCSDSATVPITIYPKPEFNITARPDSGCTPFTAKFTSPVGLNSHEWKYDNVVFGSAGEVSNTFVNSQTTPRSYSIQFTARDVYSCADTVTRVIRVFPKPTAAFAARPLIVYLPESTVSFSNASSSNAVFYSWGFGDGNVSTVKHPVHKYLSKGEYEVTLIASTSLGCRDTFVLGEKIIVDEHSTIEIPNAFTPNLSGSPGGFYDPLDLNNDVFHPKVMGAEKYSLSVYSRWGELLFDTRDPAEGWDGYYKGKVCIADVYIWKLEVTFVDGSQVKKAGEVLLLR
jgi:gliding motility-associated-like protein